MEQVRQGATPQGLAQTCGFAFSLGLCPVLGSTTFLCFIFGMLFKLNQPLIQVLNYILYPLQILFIPIFIYFGETIVGSPHISIQPSEMVQQFAADSDLFFKMYGMAGFYGFLAWALISPIVGFAVYFIVKPVLAKFDWTAS